MSDVDLERRLAAALRTPLSSSARARERVMELVREASRQGMPRRRTIAMPAFSSRGVRQSIVGVALAASIGSITALSALVPAHGASSGGATSGVIGDTVVATLRDTLRLVRLIFDDPSARRVAVVGDFNDWSADATPLRRDRSPHRWSAVVAMRDGEHRYAFVVDGTRWVPDPAAAVVRGDDGRLYTLLHVARASN